MISRNIKDLIGFSFILLFTTCLNAQTNIASVGNHFECYHDSVLPEFFETHIAELFSSSQTQPFNIVGIQNSTTLKITEVDNQNWVSGAWENKTRILYEYDYAARQSVYTAQKWSSGVWENTTKYEYAYMSSGSMESYTAYNWQNGAWVGTTKWSYTYNSSGKAIVYNGEQWDGSVWQPYMRYTYTYDAVSGRTTTMFGELYTNSAWANYQNTNYIYDSNGNETQYINQYWSNGVWTNSSNTLYEYDSNNRQTKYTYQSWSGNDWINVNQTLYTYNSDGRTQDITNFIWGSTSSSWTALTKANYTYNSNGYIDTYLTQAWTPPSGPWINSAQITYSYQEGHTQKILNTKWNGTGWDNDSQTLYTYADIVDVENNPQFPKDFNLFQNYPNPFNPSTVISYQIPEGANVTLKVFDLLGRDVATLVNSYQQAGKYSVPFIANNFKLSSGVFLYTLKSGSSLITRKMVLLQ